MSRTHHRTCLTRHHHPAASHCGRGTIYCALFDTHCDGVVLRCWHTKVQQYESRRSYRRKLDKVQSQHTNDPNPVATLPDSARLCCLATCRRGRNPSDIRFLERDPCTVHTHDAEPQTPRRRFPRHPAPPLHLGVSPEHRSDPAGSDGRVHSGPRHRARLAPAGRTAALGYRQGGVVRRSERDPEDAGRVR